jgi:hypothetical protein
VTACELLTLLAVTGVIRYLVAGVVICYLNSVMTTLSPVVKPVISTTTRQTVLVAVNMETTIVSGARTQFDIYTSVTHTPTTAVEHAVTTRQDQRVVNGVTETCRVLRGIVLIHHHGKHVVEVVQVMSLQCVRHCQQSYSQQCYNYQCHQP